MSSPRRDTQPEDVGPAVASDLLTVDVDRDGGTTVVAVAGDVDLHTVPMLRQALDDALADGALLIVVDLAHVRFMSSVGVAALLATQQRADEIGCELRLAAVSRATGALLELTGLAARFEQYDSTREASRFPLVGG